MGEETPYEELKDLPEWERTLITQHYDFIIRSLASQIEDHTLILKDKYERQFVWPTKKSSRLIESLLMNVPIPVLYFAETGHGNYSVIDGHQRLNAIYQFLNNKYKLNNLRVLDHLNGKKFKNLSEDEKNTIKSRVLRCIIISKKSDPTIRFDVFERLNTGSTPLRAQELRNCISSGKLNDLLHKLAKDSTFLSILNKAKPDKRMSGEGLVLRFLSFYYNLSNYKGDIERFMDIYQDENANPDDIILQDMEEIFKRTVTSVDSVFGKNAFRRFDPDKDAWIKNTNSAIYDAVMLGFAKAQSNQIFEKQDEILSGFKELCSNPDFLWAVGEAPVHRPRVKRRIDLFRTLLESNGIALEPINWWPET